MGDQETRTFQFLACSGAKTDDVLEKQIPKLGPNQNLITMTISGNDVGLSKILNACIFQWSYILGSEKECEEALQHAQDNIDKDLSKRLDKVIDATKRKLRVVQSSAGNLYFAGYTKLFNDETDQCNLISWSFWHVPFKQYLTRDRRKRMNDPVDAVNTKILAAVQAAGPQVVYVNYDTYFPRFLGRYCENIAIELAGNRPGLLFFE